MPPRRSSRKRKSDPTEQHDTPTKAAKTTRSPTAKPHEQQSSSDDAVDESEMKADTTCKFRVFDVTADVPEKKFADDAEFPLDRRGYYEFTKPEQVGTTPLACKLRLSPPASTYSCTVVC